MFPLQMTLEPLCMGTELQRKEGKMFKSRAKITPVVHYKGTF